MRVRVVAALLVWSAPVAWTAAAASAQDPVARFRALFQEAERVEPGRPAERADAHRRALRAFLAVPTDHADYALLLLDGARAALRAGDPALAAELAGEALARDPADGSAAAALRVVAQVRGGRVEDGFDDARRLDSDHRDAVGRALLETFGALAPVAAARLRRADSAALWWFRRVVEASGRAPYALANLALSLRFLGELDEAETLYREALSVSPDDDILWNDFGLCLRAAGRPAAAARAFAESRRRENAPGAGPATTNQLLLLRNGKPAGLERPLEAVSTLLARRPDAALARRLCLDLLIPERRRGDARARGSRR